MKKLIQLFIMISISLGINAMPKAILFDCDGVLVDTEYMKFTAWQKALHQENVDLSLEEYMKLAGSSSKIIAQAIMNDKNCKFDATKVIEYKNELYKEASSKGVEPIVPAVKYLNALLAQKKEMHIQVAIVSSDSRENILRNLKFANVNTELLDGVFSGHDDLVHINDPEGTNKPKPYIYQIAAEKLGIDPKFIIVFEDTNAGVISAHSAGMQVIALPNAFSKQHDFSKAILITSLDKFSIDDLKHINGSKTHF